MADKLFVNLTKEEQDKWELDYHGSAATVRGNVLNTATALEMSIDLCITKHFTSDMDRVENPVNVTTLIRWKLTSQIRSKLTSQIRFKLTTPLAVFK